MAMKGFILLFSLLCLNAVVAQQQCSTVVYDVDRPGIDYLNYGIPVGTNYTRCMDDCCKDPRCDAWVWAAPGVTNPTQPWCWLKEWIPDTNPLKNVVSGIKGRDPKAPPTLPFLFRWELSIQQIPTTRVPNSFSATSKWYYDYLGKKYAVYQVTPDNSVTITLYRFDTNIGYIVTEQRFANGSVNITCKSSSLTGQIFTPYFLSSSLNYTGDSLLLDKPVSLFYGANVVMFGESFWYVSLTNPPIVRRIYKQDLIHDTVYFGTDVPDGVFEDPILLCKKIEFSQ
eukprot:TRINITY_DN2058_c0_g3_i1.p1 TRINITY_DN2058_c0_g3~~TRINITY_DN2058_c0_g3_i1.p1  ORF type:complete len:284 (+),score=25.64 TRINITY_DN2058_c0_g3_i1:67-918(+)